MQRLALLAYGLLAYVGFNIAFLFFAAWCAGLVGNGGTPGSVGRALAIDLGLVALFGVTHSVMARDWFKRRLTRLIPAAAERSTYVWQSSIFLGLAVWFWQPLPGALWSVGGPAAWAIWAVAAAGICTVLLASFLINHFELFGLRQIWCGATGRPMPPERLRTPLLYRVVRHPLQSGIVLMLFATPEMTSDRLLFALTMLGYILVGLWFEERALRRTFGRAYEDYAARVPMLFPDGRVLRRGTLVAAE